MPALYHGIVRLPDGLTGRRLRSLNDYGRLILGSDSPLWWKLKWNSHKGGAWRKYHERNKILDIIRLELEQDVHRPIPALPRMKAGRTTHDTTLI